MPRDELSETAIEAMTAPETAAVALNLLTISYDGEVLLRVVDDKQAAVSQGETFEPCAFTALLPDQSSDGNKACRLQIDNTDIAIYRAIKAAAIRSRNENKNIECTAAVIIASEPDTYIQGPLTFVLRNITATVQAITGELYDAFLADRKFCVHTYTPENFPGMFF